MEGHREQSPCAVLLTDTRGTPALQPRAHAMAPHVSRDQFSARGGHGIARGVMRGIKEAWRRIRSLGRRSSIERGLDEEIRFHIDQQTGKNVRAGMSLDEARRQAMIKFGGVEQFKESVRDEFRPASLGDAVRELR